MPKYSQVFLKSERILMEIANYADLSKKDIVIEIGAGYGNLTKYLAERALLVHAIEIDKKLFIELKKNLLKFNNVNFINADALKIKFPEANKIVGNLPYEISSPITEKILKFLNDEKFKSKNKDVLAILMYQREFAERMIAEPGFPNYSRLTVFVNYFARCEILKYIPKHFFKPSPKVDSAIVKIVPKGKKYDENFFKTTNLLFFHKNNTVLKALINSRTYTKIKDKSEIKNFLENKIDKELLEKRVFELSEDEIEKIKELILPIL
ncbi:MAG: 16S rRNA (adenine(1518)-N(6)/adenine(1519)-N(6))-dimethyltransferase RsmA [Candidatus Parvarchaeota archaeon]|nr:16S rRNA (adenine(1518)-N(6)/adenine(1519)-N(6))-dimethyltransferase RsmA [Candidatus Jingweiarchaeum tengchongense]MCW1298238.1 16S rRNA (adenine(1518)-N(6)/adenine(1519)-N(6))-dimethyltransferase RsmA [Candidatus Jingweiarchaeum tengchongense]MCW1300036.1 16S rRNA (adenine(1518)-N(6)/adenine(1519)-N(6))-dimethyltransferase RsmA [Candidatus Jingweiarchaeum tengchongense]MCW1304825.1 16S rRNA (adenine(1518)-N(6)/adenine(1519)-N(6))-dimethyltransferase RsmA [Candidatus Jingweiarchaeum tengchon